eukprot:TRINITY_DN16276_c0_g1_i1.p1 TRINITY_DN16276_c0_g1~~TRINITY_DN16276_c0_g1_i1.p1  ORF type:complete len:186 (+),score=36.33 TRINITY_DN16276_c0_g1_i1:113-670(+)
MATEWLDLEGVSLHAVAKRTDRKVQNQVHNTALIPIQRLNMTKELKKRDLYREYNRQRRRSLERLRKRNAIEPQYPIEVSDDYYPGPVSVPQPASPPVSKRMPQQVGNFRSPHVPVTYTAMDSLASPVWDHQEIIHNVPQPTTTTTAAIVQPALSTISESDRLMSTRSTHPVADGLPAGSPPLLF